MSPGGSDGDRPHPMRRRRPPRGQPRPAAAARWDREAYDRATVYPDALSDLMEHANPTMPEHVRARYEREFERLMRPVLALELAYERDTGDRTTPHWEFVSDPPAVWEELRAEGVLARIGVEIVEWRYHDITGALTVNVSYD